MIVTEREAQEKICPFARTFDGTNTPAMPVGWDVQPKALDKVSMPRCLGSACMAWDWVDGTLVSASHRDFGQPLPARPGHGTPEVMPEDEYVKLVDAYMTEQGWHKANPVIHSLSVSAWHRPHPAPRGQCQRTLSLAEDR